MKKTFNDLKDQVNQTRRDIVRMVHAVQSGHPGGSLGCAEFFTVLFQNILRNKPASFQMTADHEDVFVLSNGHGSMLLYALLHLSGYDLSIDDLKNFREFDLRYPNGFAARFNTTANGGNIVGKIKNRDRQDG